MLQLTNGSIQEVVPITLTTTSGYADTTSNCYQTFEPITYWSNYPVYVCTDKTKKAIEVLKALQTEKLLECKSVPRFIELVEKVANLL